MRIDARSLGIRRRWLVMFSLAWIVAVYTLWVLLFMPDARAMFDNAQSQCSPLIRSDAYAYAECLQVASETANREHGSVATSATLVAILPISLLWVLFLGSRFLLACRDAIEHH